MIKNFFKGVLGLFLPAILAFLASGYGNPVITWTVAVLGYLVSAFIYRAPLLMLVGTRLYHSKPGAGVKIMRLAYKTGKLNPSYQLIFAYVLIRLGHLEEAETVMQKALVIGRHTLTEQEVKASDFNRALITWKKGDISAAIVQLEELYEMGYKTPAFFGALASFYLINKEFDKALKIAKEGVEYNSSDLVSKDNMGQAYIELGMPEEAEAVYKELIPLNPGFLEAYYNYATVMEKHGDLENARRYYGLALTYEEKFLSVVSHKTVQEALERVEALLA